MKKINDWFSIIEKDDNPLSSDIAVLSTKHSIWIFDVGASIRAKEEINSIVGNKNVVISHFHKDHLGNINDVIFDQLYVSYHTYKYTNKGIIVNEDVDVDDVKIIPLPNSHAKGSLALQVNNYLFVGDSLAPCCKNNKCLYNVQMLKEEIEVIERLNVDYIVSSHNMENKKTKKEVINKLTELYQSRERNNPYIQTSEY